MKHGSFILLQSLVKFIWTIYSVQFVSFSVRYNYYYSWVPFQQIKELLAINKKDETELFMSFIALPFSLKRKVFFLNTKTLAVIARALSDLFRNPMGGFCLFFMHIE